MKNLLELRDEIDVIDRQIVALYQKRMQISGEVAEYKIETGRKVFDKDRESGNCLNRSCRSAGNVSIS